MNLHFPRLNGFFQKTVTAHRGKRRRERNQMVKAFTKTRGGSDRAICALAEGRKSVAYVAKMRFWKCINKDFMNKAISQGWLVI